ncbi:hypothetical protein H8959_004376 [Pygathrix nigripes]
MSRLLREVMLHFALLLAVGLPLVAANVAVGPQWTYSLRCHDCAVINDFNCPSIRTCQYHVRRCMTISIRINPRELLVYKNCTYNCTFLYAAQQPPEAPRKIFKTNSFYWVRCCNSMVCNAGGPTNLERDMLPDEVIEEELPEGTRGGVCVGPENLPGQRRWGWDNARHQERTPTFSTILKV